MVTFKRFIGIGSLLTALLAISLSAGACVPEAPRHNNYLFSVFNRSLMSDRFTDATDKYWQQYLGNPDAQYRWDVCRDEVMKKARRQKDAELLGYCRSLNAYIGSDVNFNAWDYPTRQKIARRNAVLHNLLQTSKIYQGKRFRAQYNLLRMRALFGLKRYQEAMTFWTSTGQRMQPSVYRDMMRNLYAGCLWRTGRRDQAIEIYAAQQDYQSLKYCVRGYRSLAGIQKVYSTRPNSATLVYLVQDFVNNVQETMDVYELNSFPYADYNNTSKDHDEWMKETDAKKVTTTEANRFIDFARGVVAQGKTSVPCLWQTAIGCLEHQLRRYDKAKEDLAKAMKLAGTPRMKDNARAIYAINSVFSEQHNVAYDKWLTGEMRWLDVKSAEDRKSLTLYETDHYRDVEERMVYNGLVPMFMAAGRTNAALVLLSRMNDTAPDFSECNARAVNFETDDDTKGNWDYQGFYFDALSKTPLDSLKAYSAYLRKQPADSLEHYAWQQAYRDANYYNDLIGTRLLAQARFAEAIPYLEKVGLDFLNTQNIAPYAAQRDYNKERWMGKQRVALPEYPIDEKSTRLPRLTVNRKLQYCRDMVSLIQQYDLMRPSEERMRKAYKLATLWYQGSYEGDCWWMKQYGISTMQDSTAVGTEDFVAKAISLLGESVRSNDFTLREKSLYALAFIRHGDPWFFSGWDDKTQKYYDLGDLRPLSHSRQYKAMASLAAFWKENAPRVDNFVSTCDILKRFCKIQ